MSFEFKFTTNFPTFGSDMIDESYADVLVQFAGVMQLWADVAPEIRDSKRTLCMNYILAWYLADLYPSSVVGLNADGGKPLGSKSINGVSLNFKEVPCPPGLEQFTTNAFGLEALRMILGAPERWKIYG